MAYTVVDNPAEYFNTVLYTGTGANQTITVGFQPDWVWTKSRSLAYSNEIQDAVRGSTKVNYTDNTNAEDTTSTNIQSFNSTGYVQGSGTGVNGNGATFVSWNWLGANTTVSNTAGSITSTVSANTTAGFSIVSYTGTGTGSPTVGHGLLGVTPKMIIIKSRSSVANWAVGHASAGWNTAGVLNGTFSFGSSTYFASTNPTSSVFSIQDNTVTNISSATYIAYCFAEVKGYSKFGSYTGNGSTDGTFVYTGFKPAFLIVKRYNDAGYDWLMYDNKRQVQFNVVDDFLKPNLSDAETTGNANQSLDFLSNGVKFRGSGASSNGSGSSYIYMAFAENPFTSSKGIPCTAR